LSCHVFTFQLAHRRQTVSLSATYNALNVIDVNVNVNYPLSVPN